MHSPLYITKPISLYQVAFLFVYDEASNNLCEKMEQDRKGKKMLTDVMKCLNFNIYKLFNLCIDATKSGSNARPSTGKPTFLKFSIQ